MQAIIWEGDKKTLKLLDQRRLPHHLEYLEYTNATGVAEAIRDMVVRGAPAIGIAGAFGLALEAITHTNKYNNSPQNPDTLTKKLKTAYQVLLSSRPTAVNLAWALDRLMNKLTVLKNKPYAVIADILSEEAVEIMQEDILINRRIGEAGAGLVPPGTRLLTHCNAGALATGGWGTALSVVRSAFRQGKIKMVYAGETRPYLQGARLTAFELKSDGIPVTLITDSCAGYLMSKGNIDMVVTGADRVTSRGDVANKIGTYALAVLSHYHGIPFYIAAPLSTFDFKLDKGSSIVVEERSATEITSFMGVPVAPKEVMAYNPSFDVTPAELITAIITENGIMKFN